MMIHAQMLGQAMTDRIELLFVAVTGAVLGTITGYELGHERLGISGLLEWPPVTLNESPFRHFYVDQRRFGGLSFRNMPMP